MADDATVAVIGAGVAGIACGRALAAAGVPVRLFDKGRGIGGRVATRRANGFAFDHGAQYATARGPAFRAALQPLLASGMIAPWSAFGAGEARYVGVPGMTALARGLADGLAVTLDTQVAAIERGRAGWTLFLEGGGEAGPFLAVALTPPVPQTLALLPPGSDFAAILERVRYAPSWTLLAGFALPTRAAADLHRPSFGPLGWVARDSGKPGRPMMEAWVGQATADWSRANVELEPDAAAALLLPALVEAAGVDTAPAHIAAHRWRYAMVETAAGVDYLWDGALGVAGDGMLGARVEAAFDSGHLLGEAMAAEFG